MTYDVSETLAPKSDQLDAVDLLDGPRIFTVQETSVRLGDDQPVSIRLVEFPRVWRPSKNMRRILAFAWGRDSRAWAGKQMELFCDPAVKFGGDAVGGTRIKSLSDIGGKPIKIPLLISKGKTAVVTVQPLKEAPRPKPERGPAEPTAEQVAACTDTDELRAWWQVSGTERRTQIQARVAELNAATEADPFEGAEA